jgi:isoleucyl-tRNA synthetase
MAPILSFTAEEIWQYMPDASGKASSIHLMDMPDIDDKWQNAEVENKWDILVLVRGEVTKALEEARAQKLIGHSLDALVTLSAEGYLLDNLSPYEKELHTVFIISEAALVGKDQKTDEFKGTHMEGLWIKVGPADGGKCDRCWIHDLSVGADAETPNVCDRCQQALNIISDES